MLELAEKLSSGDIFVMDAFGSAHRQHASTFGVAELSDTACAGLLLEQELLLSRKQWNLRKSP